MKGFKAIVVDFFWGLVIRINPSRLERILVRLITHYSSSLTPAEGLRFLFGLDKDLYRLQGRLSVEYGGGLHTKHRHIRYHDFFVSNISSDESVLDVGCGIGAVAYSVAKETGARVLGVDYVPNQISIAQQRFKLPNLEFMVGDATDELPVRHFDVVILSNVLEHIEKRPCLLQNLQLKISPSRFLIRVPLYERDWRVPLKKELGVEWRLDEDHKTEYTIDSFRDEIDQAGLIVKQLEVHWGEIWSEVAA